MSSIEQADFIAIDTEFSGCASNMEEEPSEYDTTEEQYQKLRTAINKFIAFQIGICTFKWNDETKKYNYRPFSFYVWPKSKVGDQTMMFHVSDWP